MVVIKDKSGHVALALASSLVYLAKMLFRFSRLLPLAVSRARRTINKAATWLKSEDSPKPRSTIAEVRPSL